MMRNAIRGLPGKAIVFAAILLVTPVTRVQALPPDDIAQLIRRWDSMSASIVTTKLKCRHLVMTPDYPYPRPNGKPVDPVEENKQKRDAISASLTRRQFHDLFMNTLVPRVGTEEWASAMQRETKLFLASVDAKVDYWWEELSIIDDGQSLRNETRFDGDIAVMRVRTPGGELHYSTEDNQATITDQPTPLRMYCDKDIRFVPVLKMAGEDVSHAVVKSLDQGAGARLTVGATELDLDPKTGFVSHWVPRLSAKEMPRVEIWQDSPRLFSGSVLFPRISAHAKYYAPSSSDNEPRLMYVDVYVVESAEFNKEISAEHFKVAAPTGAIIVNLTEQRKSKSDVPAVKADQDLDDITTQEFPPRP